MVYLSFKSDSRNSLAGSSIRFIEASDCLLVSFAEIRPHLMSNPESPLFEQLSFEKLVFSDKFEEIARVASQDGAANRLNPETP